MITKTDKQIFDNILWLRENQDKVHDSLMLNYLKNERNRKLLNEIGSLNSEQVIEALNLSFKKFYTGLQITKYISQLIDHYSGNFYRKKSREQHHHIFAIDDDQAISDTPIGDSQTFSDELELSKRFLLDQVGSFKIYKALLKLTERQLCILNLHYFHQLSQKEIAFKLGVSQQLVSKTIKSALEKIRVEIK